MSGHPENEISDEPLTLSLRAAPDASARAGHVRRAARPTRERHVARLRPRPAAGPRARAPSPPPASAPPPPAIAIAAAARRPAGDRRPRRRPPPPAPPLLRRPAPPLPLPPSSAGERARAGRARSIQISAYVDFSRLKNSSKSLNFLSKCLCSRCDNFVHVAPIHAYNMSNCSPRDALNFFQLNHFH